jgi:hypothetical protein
MQLQISSVDKPRLGLHILAVTTLLFALGAEVKAEVKPDVKAEVKTEVKTEVKPEATSDQPVVATVAGPLNPPILGDFETDPARKSPRIGGLGGGSASRNQAIAQQPATMTSVVGNPMAKPVTTTEVAAEEECECQLKLKLASPNDNGAVLDAPAGIIVMQYKQGKTVELRVNGELVNANQIGNTETDGKRKRVTQTWYGVPLKPGNNTLTATANDGETTTLTVQVRGLPKQISLTIVESRVPADGQTLVNIKGQLVDEQGTLSRGEAVITLASNGGEFVGKDAEPLLKGFQVIAKDGQFTAQLRSGVEAKDVQIRAATNGMEAFTKVAFEPNLRPSIATGSLNFRLAGRGNDYYGSLRNFLPADGDNGLTANLQGRVFAMGKLGPWAFTGALNSSDTLNKTCNDTNRLFRVNPQPCDNEYPTYGDGSKSEILTPSIDSVYFKLEKTAALGGATRDYLMWGDYHTEEFATKSQQYTAFTRELHGFKGNYYFGPFQVSGLFANNVKGFQRDTLNPDGTSRDQFLSRRQLVEGSENVFVELEELNRPGTVYERTALARGADYTVDYDRGTLQLKEPLFRTDISRTGETLVRRIVVTYQYDEIDTKNQIYGARARYHISKERDREAWLGGSYIQENLGSRNFELYGFDAYIGLGENTGVIAEFARSKNDSDVVGTVNGNAVRIEAGGAIAKGVDAQAYYRRADSGFSNNSTVSFVPGQTRYGVQGSAKVGKLTTLRGQVDHELNQGTAPQPLTTFADLFNPQPEALPGVAVDNSLTTVSAGILQRFGTSALSPNMSVDWFYRNREDRLSPGILDGSSHQLRSRFELPINERVKLIAQNETTLAGDVDPIYNDRTLLGLDWKIMNGVNLQLAQQFFHKGQYSGRQITSVNVTGDYNLTPSTQLRSRYTVFGGAENLSMQGAIGIKQDVKLSDKFKIDFGYERVFGDFFGTTATGTQFLQPFAFGQSASALGVTSGDVYNIGFNYVDSDRFQMGARYERRNSSLGNNQVITATANGKITPALTGLFKYKQSNASNQTITGLGDTVTLRAGLAYRNPKSDKFNALFRYEYRKNPGLLPDTFLNGTGNGYSQHLVGLEGVYAPNWRWEFFSRLALRTSTSDLANDLKGTSTVTLAQVRASYRLSSAWDVTGEARWLNQSSTSYGETGLSAEVGYQVTPNLRLAGGYSLGRSVDREFSDGDRRVGGPYLSVSLKLNDLFQGFGQQNWAKPASAETAPVETTPPPVVAPPVTPPPPVVTPIPVEPPLAPITPPESQTKGSTKTPPKKPPIHLPQLW